MVYVSKNSNFSPSTSMRAKTINSLVEDDELDETGSPQGMGTVNTQVDAGNSPDPQPPSLDYGMGMSWNETGVGSQQTGQQMQSAAQAAGGGGRQTLDDVYANQDGGRQTLEDVYAQPQSSAPSPSPYTDPRQGELPPTSDPGGGVPETWADVVDQLMQQEGIDADQRIADERAIMEAGLGGNLANLAAQMGGAGFGQSGQALQGSFDLENQAAMNFNRRAAEIQDQANAEKLERLAFAQQLATGAQGLEQGELRNRLLQDLLEQGDGGGGGGDGDGDSDEYVKDEFKTNTSGTATEGFTDWVGGLIDQGKAELSQLGGGDPASQKDPEQYRDEKYGNSDASVTKGLQEDGFDVKGVVPVSSTADITQTGMVHKVTGDYYYDERFGILYKVG